MSHLAPDHWAEANEAFCPALHTGVVVVVVEMEGCTAGCTSAVTLQAVTTLPCWWQLYMLEAYGEEDEAASGTA